MLGATRPAAALRLRLLCGLLAMLATLTLGCITTTMGVQVTHPWMDDSEASVIIEYLQELDSQYAVLAREASQDILAECAKSPVPCSVNPRLPETFDEMMAQMGSNSTGLSGLEESGFSRVEWIHGVRYRKIVPVREFLDLQAQADTKAKAEGKTAGDAPRLEIRKDPATGNTHYVFEMTFPGMGDDPEDAIDWGK
jgi:hypothetical protein